jgi:membrane protein YqaA with SNARE-associated domain
MKKYILRGVTILLLLTMVGVAIALWRGVIPIQWLASLGYKGIFVLSLMNGVAPVAGPSQIVTFFAARVLNPLGVGLAAGIGGAIGELATYLFGYSFRESKISGMEEKIQRLSRYRLLKVSRERSFFPLFVLASFPNPFFKPVCVVAGSLELGKWRYFIPVVIGKTMRHVIIAYAGFYSISISISSLSRRPSVTLVLSSLPFVLSLALIALASWLVRSFADSDPDPFLLNFTFFAFAGQCISTFQLIRVTNPGVVILLLLIGLILVLLQVVTVRSQASTTFEHYRTVLDQNKTQHCTTADVDHWANALVRITGLDFWPELYSLQKKGFGKGFRAKRRQEGLSVLPTSLFNKGSGALRSEDLTVPEDARKWLWRSYYLICIGSWGLFITGIVIERT